MAIRLADTTTAMGDFPVVEAKEVSVEIGATTKYLQDAIDNGEIGGGSSTFVGLKADWESLLPTEKAKYEFVDFTDDVDDALIDDTSAHTNKVYSSSKVESLIGGLIKTKVVVGSTTSLGNFNLELNNNYVVVSVNIVDNNDNARVIVPYLSNLGNWWATCMTVTGENVLRRIISCELTMRVSYIELL